MVFWGVEVKSGKPYTYTHTHTHTSKGRLHLSQAVLANAKSEREVVVQCNVGDKTPIYLCALSLSPGAPLRCCQLNLEFQEADDVIFSVIGRGTVHLSGYYLHGGAASLDDDDDESESYGEDIAETETDKSVGSDEDKYEDSFIDDSEPEFMTPSTASSHGEDTIHVEENRHSKGSCRRLKKMFQISESDDFSQQQNLASHRAHIVVSESETDDELPICTLIKDKRFESDPRFNEDEESRVVKDDATGVTTSNKNPDAYVSGEPERLVEQQHMVGSENGIKRKKKKKLGSENGTQLNKKEKEQSKEGKPPETVIENDFFSGMGLKWANTLQIKTDANKVGLDLSINGQEQKNPNDRGDNMPQVPLHFDGVVSADVGKSNKKRKKKMKHEKCHEANTALPCDSKDEPLQDDAEAKGNGQAMSFHCEETPKSANDDLANNSSKNVELHSTLMCSEIFSSPKRKRIDLGEEKTLEDESGSHGNGIEDDKAKQDEFKAEVLDHKMLVQSVQSQNEANFMMLDNSVGQSDAEIYLEKKNKRKNQVIGDKDTSVTDIEHKNVDKMSSNHRTLSNGLIIEDLEMGKPDSRVAITGKKITVRFTAKLKETGEVFNSNIDGEPLKFRLGKGKVLKGLDVGIDGMRVGDKRRLIVPPSLGYGSEGDCKDVPPNSWLVYEVELLKVR